MNARLFRGFSIISRSVRAQGNFSTHQGSFLPSSAIQFTASEGTSQSEKDAAHLVTSPVRDEIELQNTTQTASEIEEDPGPDPDLLNPPNPVLRVKDLSIATTKEDVDKLFAKYVGLIGWERRGRDQVIVKFIDTEHAEIALKDLRERSPIVEHPRGPKKWSRFVPKYYFAPLWSPAHKVLTPRPPILYRIEVSGAGSATEDDLGRFLWDVGFIPERIASHENKSGSFILYMNRGKDVHSVVNGINRKKLSLEDGTETVLSAVSLDVDLTASPKEPSMSPSPGKGPRSSTSNKRFADTKSTRFSRHPASLGNPSPFRDTRRSIQDNDPRSSLRKWGSLDSSIGEERKARLSYRGTPPRLPSRFSEEDRPRYSQDGGKPSSYSRFNTGQNARGGEKGTFMKRRPDQYTAKWSENDPKKPFSKWRALRNSTASQPAQRLRSQSTSSQKERDFRVRAVERGTVE